MNEFARLQTRIEVFLEPRQLRSLLAAFLKQLFIVLNGRHLIFPTEKATQHPVLLCRRIVSHISVSRKLDQPILWIAFLPYAWLQRQMGDPHKVALDGLHLSVADLGVLDRPKIQTELTRLIEDCAFCHGLTKDIDEVSHFMF